MYRRGIARQAGAATVELALVSLVFMTLMLAVVEFGRALYTWNALVEATRLGARAAALCPVQADAIAGIALFNGGGLLSDITSQNIGVEYLDENGAVVADPTPANVSGFMQVRYVRVSIRNYQYTFLIPGIGTIAFPPFSTTLPRESLGIVPNEAPGC